MGLDMYLNANRYLWYHESELSESVSGVVPCPFTDKVEEVKYEAIYWRKANAIHNWFVNNVQEGVDDCRSYEVEVDKLKELRDTCTKVIKVAKLDFGVVQNGSTMTNAEEGFIPNYKMGTIITNPEEISEILPVKGGFFFGSTNYDQWYFKYVKYTRTKLNKILKTPKDELNRWYFTYRASW